MTSKKTKRMAAVAALSASLVIGGAAAYAQADGPACVHGQGKGMGTGAPGNDKGKGADTGWSHGCKDHGQSGDDHGHQGGGDTVGTTDGHDVVDVDASVEVTLPDLPALPDPVATAQDAAGDAVNILTPAAESVVGQALDTAGQATVLAGNDVTNIAGLVENAESGLTSLDPGSVDAGLNVSGGSASGSVDASTGTSGVTSLGGDLLGQATSLLGGNSSGLMGIVSGMTLPL